MTGPEGFISFDAFKKTVPFSLEEMCRDFIKKNKGFTTIKKEKLVLKNLMTIVSTTLRISNEKGFQNMSTRELSKESGLSMGALYSYFPNKGELLSMIHDQGNKYVRELLHKELHREDLPEKKLRRLICLHLYISEIMKEWFYFFYMETKNLDKNERKKPIQSELMTESLFVDILMEGKDALYETDATLTASAIKAMLQDWYLKRWKYSRRKISVDEYALFLIKFVEAYLSQKPYFFRRAL